MARNQIQGTNGGILEPNLDGTVNVSTTIAEGEDIATETTLDTKLNSLETKMDTLLNSQDTDDNINVSQKGIKGINAEEVTPNDSQDTSYITNGIFLGGAGDLVVTLQDMTDGDSITFKDLAAGVIHPLKVKRVWDTNTTAADIVAVY